MDNLKEVREQVESVLAENQLSRSSDKVLQVLVLKKFYGVNKIEDILNPNVPSLESIRRNRQKLQAEGKYKANDHTMRARRKMEEVYYELAVTRE